MEFPLLILTVMLACGAGAAQSRQFNIQADEQQLVVNGRVLLDARQDGFMSVKQVLPSPDGRRVAVLACGYECNDNVGFLFNADGSGKRRFTARWDFILQDKLEWSADGSHLFYYRIHSSAAEPPRQTMRAAPEGWVELELPSMRKAPATHRELKPDTSYAVFNAFDTGSLNVRRAASRNAPAAGAIPDGSSGIRVTGKKIRVGREEWVPIRFGSLAGWVNQRYLYEVSNPDEK
jgi:hypothetical protein